MEGQKAETAVVVGLAPIHPRTNTQQTRGAKGKAGKREQDRRSRLCRYCINGRRDGEKDCGRTDQQSQGENPKRLCKSCRIDENRGKPQSAPPALPVILR